MLEPARCEVSVGTEGLKPKKSINSLLDQMLQKKKFKEYDLNRLKRKELRSPLKVPRFKTRNLSYIPYRNSPKSFHYPENPLDQKQYLSNYSQFHLPKIGKIGIREIRITPNSLQSLDHLKVTHSPYNF